MSDELVTACRSIEYIVSVPHGEHGSKITIVMTEETSLFDIISAAWDVHIRAAAPEGQRP